MNRTHVMIAVAMAVAVMLARAEQEQPVDGPVFAQQFRVSTGTTIPLGSPSEPDVEPMALSGNIYYDFPGGRIRIDSSWQDDDRTLLIHFSSGRLYLLQDGGKKCTSSRVTGQLRPFGLAETAARSDEQFSVRGARVRKYTSVETVSGNFREMDMYVLARNMTSLIHTVDEFGGPKGTEYFVPWRTVHRRIAPRRTLPEPTKTRPNWRFFGDEPLEHDEVVLPSHELVHHMASDVPVTTDYFNFVVGPPAPEVFTVPSSCVHADESSAEFEEDVDLMEAQRQVSDMSFHTLEGVKRLQSMYLKDDEV